MSLTDALLLDPLGPPRMDVWIALRTDGAMGSGTEDDPYDGSTINPTGYPISAIVHSAQIATAVCVGHPFVVGDYVLVSGVKGTGTSRVLGGFFNGVFRVDSVATDLFSYTMYGTPPADPTDFTATTAKLEPYRFDATMRSLRSSGALPPVTVHIGPGVFETKGYSNVAPASWTPFSGMRVMGSGMNITTLKLVGVTVPDAAFHVIAGPYDNYLTGFGVSDLTIDCNLPGQALEPATEFPYAPVVCGAIGVTGCHIRVSRVRAIRWGTQTDIECFVIAAASSHPQIADVFDCVIEDCVCDTPSQNNYRETSVLHMGGSEGNAAGIASNSQKFTRAVVLRNNFVDCGFSNGKPSFIVTAAGMGPWDSINKRGPFVGTRPHNRVSNEYVRLTGPNGWNGYFKIYSTPTPLELVLEIPNNPGSPVGSAAFIGTSFNALSMGACVAGVVEGNFVQNAWIGGPYQDFYRTRDITIRNNRFRNVVAGAYWLLGKNGSPTAVSLVRSEPEGVVTGTTLGNHLLIAGDRIHVRPPDPPNPPTGFEGFFELLSAPTSTTFTYADPGPNASSTTESFERVWGVDRILVQGNSYELADLKNTEWGAPPIAISLVDGSPTLITSPPPFVHQEIVVRGNRVRYTDGGFASDNTGYGIALLGAAKAIVEDNVIESTDPAPIKFARCGQVRCQNNSTPGGVAIRGINLSNFNAKYDDLATRIEDAMVATFL